MNVLVAESNREIAPLLTSGRGSKRSSSRSLAYATSKTKLERHGVVNFTCCTLGHFVFNVRARLSEKFVLLLPTPLR